jgi:type II secretory pathway pseudopilin PulG
MNQFKFYNHSKAFTLIEGLVVIGLLGLIITGSALALRGKKDNIIFREAQATIVRALEKARNRAETGFGTGDHGVSINGNTVTIFEDCESICEPDINMFLPASVFTNPANVEITFSRITADTGADTSITLLNSNGLTSIIDIMSDGTIISNSSP